MSKRNRPVKGESRFVDFDEESKCWGIFGEKSDFCYGLYGSKDAANKAI